MAPIAIFDCFFFLQDLVKDKEKVDWDWVAKEMGNGRTAFGCFQRYQVRHNKQVDSRFFLSFFFAVAKRDQTRDSAIVLVQHRTFGWTAADDERLTRVVHQSTDPVHGTTDWIRVLSHFPGRFKDQIYSSVHSFFFFLSLLVSSLSLLLLLLLLWKTMVGEDSEVELIGALSLVGFWMGGGAWWSATGGR